MSKKQFRIDVHTLGGEKKWGGQPFLSLANYEKKREKMEIDLTLQNLAWPFFARATIFSRPSRNYSWKKKTGRGVKIE